MSYMTTQIDLTKLTTAELIAWAQKTDEENRKLRLQEEMRQEEKALKEEIKKEKRAIPTRNTLVLRRTPDHESIAPARDVLAYLKVYDLKQPHTETGKKTKVSDEEINAYQMLKADGLAEKDITVEMIAGRVKGEPVAQTEEEEDASEMEDQN